MSMANTIGVGTFTTTPRMRELVNEVLDDNRLSYGPKSRQFESEFAGIHEVNHAILSNSGTSSLHVALQALKEIHNWQDGDEVITQSCTFVATVNVILHNHLTPVLVDVEPDYYGLDPTKLAQAITPRTKCIIPVHLFGQPCDLTSITEISRSHDLKIIEDSCECMFATHANRPVGSWGDIGCFSTYIAHLLATGVGGLGITNNPDYAIRMRSLVNHGRDSIYLSIDDDDGLTGTALREVVDRRFRFEHIGHSFRITELESALALAQLETWPEMIRARQANAERLTNGLAHLNDHLQLPSIRPYTTHSFMMYPIITLNTPKHDLVHHLESQHIETRDLLRLTDQPCYHGLWDPDDYPVAKWINESGFYIGVHQDLTLDDLDYIITRITEFYE